MGSQGDGCQQNAENVDATVSELENAGEISSLHVDLSNPDSVADFIARLQDVREINYLVNASGICRPKPFLEATAGEYDAYLNINRSFYLITQAVARKMKENGKGGAIVNIGSYRARHAIKGSLTWAYSMAKRASTRLPNRLPWNWPSIRSGSTPLRRASWKPTYSTACSNLLKG
ncbi:MAG: SDR family oxidoreductase [Cytophagales bacterium]|nr:SDR family oxidoreductase [Cytophagales bacterium]